MRQVIHALLTRPPLSQSSVRKLPTASFDLHVLGTPPAFILSQDQTLMLKFVSRSELSLAKFLNRSTVVLGFLHSERSHSWPKHLSHFYKNFQGFTYCSVFKVLCFVVVVSRDSQITISQLHSLVNIFFKFFEILF